jgi:hypothetical protein
VPAVGAAFREVRNRRQRLAASMALAGPVGEGLGVPATFFGAAVVPIALSVVALVAWRLPADEIAHPLDERVGDPMPTPATAPSAPR